MDIVVADLLISESLVSLGQFDKAVVERVYCLILGGVGANLVWVVNQRKALIVSRNRFLVGTLHAMNKKSMLAI